MSDISQNPQNLIGRFVVEYAGYKDTGLTADVVIERLNDPEWDALGIYKIHRVDAEGRLELVGVEDEDFDDNGVFLLTATDVKDARAGYERLIEFARSSPPPCKAELHMARVGAGGNRRYVVSMELPAICLDVAGRWLDRAAPPGLVRSGQGVKVLLEYQESQPEVIIRDTLQP